MNVYEINNNLTKTVQKGWGHELWIHNDEKYCGKLLFLKKGKKCSLHYHKLKTETFYIQQGVLDCTFYMLDEPEQKVNIVLKEGDVKEIPPGLVHQMRAVEDTVLFEFSTQHFDSDSYRIEKGD
tara:strand:- start:9210 stop:9581 length:372 start_codon:yes stop_codon:yes gene_type:complete